MNKIAPEISDVTDTALWVAAYRAEESAKSDGLFKDEFAAKLIGDQGFMLATRTQGSRYTAWSVVIRTLIIDQFITNLIESKNNPIDTVLNLGAGLDTRPYRMNLPKNLKWIEVDFPKIIEHKEEILKNDKPNCQLKRYQIDLSNVSIRDEFLKEISTQSKSVLIITEGVVPYLSNEDAASLATSLFQFSNFNYWITEYYSPEILKFLRTPKRIKQMKNAPFLFYPEDWFNFFSELGWLQFETKYFGVESERIGRTPPTPGWIKKNSSDLNIEQINAVKYFLGYSILARETK